MEQIATSKFRWRMGRLYIMLAKVGSETIVRILIRVGSDVNAKLLNGMTPLHLAAQGWPYRGR